MKTLPLSITAMFAILPFTASAANLYLAIDVSGSNPLLTHENYAYVAANFVAEKIAPLRSGDKVEVQTFGARGAPANMLNQTYEISRRVRPDTLADLMAQYIRALPKRKDIAQGATEILGWIELHPDFGCEQGSQILILTDGLESSHTVQAQKLADGKATLPDPDVALSGCSLTLYGLGAGMPTPMAKNIRTAWQAWAKKSGADFHAVIP